MTTADATIDALVGAGRMVPLLASHEVLERVSELLLDSIGNAVAGSGVEAVVRLQDAVRRMSNSPEQGVIGSALQTGATFAALVNATSMRALDINDAYLAMDPRGDVCHLQDVHGALLAVAWRERSSIDELLKALVASYEAMAAACEAYSVHARSHVDQSVYTALAVPVGAGYLMKLSSHQVANAISISLASNVGLGQTRRGRLSMWKSMQVPYAGKSGLEACDLASAGITGPDEVFAGDHGLLALLGMDRGTRLQLDCESAGFRTLRGCIKPYAANYLAQPAIEAAISCRSALGPLEAEDIEEIIVHTFDFALSEIDEAKFQPDSRETADHSTPYLVAVAVVAGEISETHYSTQWLEDRKIRALMRRSTFRPHATHNGEYPDSLWTSVEVRTRDGKSASAEVEVPKGHHRRPMKQVELIAKFNLQVGPRWPRSRAEATVDLLLGGTHSASVRDLASVING